MMLQRDCKCGEEPEGFCSTASTSDTKAMKRYLMMSSYFFHGKHEQAQLGGAHDVLLGIHVALGETDDAGLIRCF